MTDRAEHVKMVVGQLELSWASYKKHGPATSKSAAIATEKSGRAAERRKLLLRAVQTRPGRTSAELAVACTLDRHEAARRLPELREMGLVRNGEARVCDVQGTKALTWWINVHRMALCRVRLSA